MRREEVRPGRSSCTIRTGLTFRAFSCPTALVASSDLAAVLEGAELVLVGRSLGVRPRDVSGASPPAPPGAPLVSATKGLETDTLLRMSEVAAQEAPGRPLAVVSGPSFALEVARELPTALVAASTDHALAESVQRALSTPRPSAPTGATTSWASSSEAPSRT